MHRTSCQNLSKKILGFHILLYMISIKEVLDGQNAVLQVLVPRESWMATYNQKKESMETILRTRMQSVILTTIHIISYVNCNLKVKCKSKIVKQNTKLTY